MPDVILDLRASQTLALEGLAADICRQIQVARKKLDLPVTKRIKLVVVGDEYVRAAVNTCDMSDLLVEDITIGNGVPSFSIDGEEPVPLKVNHTRCNVEDGEIFFHGDGEFANYWEALEEWAKIKEKE